MLLPMQEPSRTTATDYSAPPSPRSNCCLPIPQPSPRWRQYYSRLCQYYSLCYLYYSVHCILVRVLIGIAVYLIVLFGGLFGIIWLMLRPTLPNFTLTTLTISNFSTTPQSLTVTCHLSFLVHNGNRVLTATYKASPSFLFYRDNSLAHTELPPFIQDPRSVTTLNATLSALDVHVDPRAINDFNVERVQGLVLFDVHVRAPIELSWWSEDVLKVLCEKVPVGISGNATVGSLVGGARKCEVGIVE